MEARKEGEEEASPEVNPVCGHECGERRFGRRRLMKWGLPAI